MHRVHEPAGAASHQSSNMGRPWRAYMSSLAGGRVGAQSSCRLFTTKPPMNSAVAAAPALRASV